MTTKASQTAKKKRRKTLLWIARSARETSRPGLDDPANLTRETRTRKLRSKKKMLVPLKPQHKTTPPSKNTGKVVSSTGKTTAKTPCSRKQKNTKEEASSRHKRELSLSDLSDSDDNDDDDAETGAKDNTCYGDGNGADASNGKGDSTGAGGGSAEWMQFLILSAPSETLAAMAKAKAPSSKNREKPEVGKK